MIMILQPKTLYVRVFEDKPVALFCVSEQVNSEQSFYGKMLALTGTNGNSGNWYAHDQLLHVNEQTIFVIAGVTFRPASESDLSYILSNWNREYDKPSRESWLLNLTTNILHFSELKRLRKIFISLMQKILN